MTFTRLCSIWASKVGEVRFGAKVADLHNLECFLQPKKLEYWSFFMSVTYWHSPSCMYRVNGRENHPRRRHYWAGRRNSGLVAKSLACRHLDDLQLYRKQLMLLRKWSSTPHTPPQTRQSDVLQQRWFSYSLRFARSSRAFKLQEFNPFEYASRGTGADHPVVSRGHHDFLVRWAHHIPCEWHSP